MDMIYKSKMCSIFLALFISSLSACASLPGNRAKTYPLMPASKAIEVIHQRQLPAKQITGKGLLTLSHENGESIRLSTVFVLEPPNNARVRTSKLNHTVFDLTLTKQGLWILVPDNSDKTKKLKKISAQMAKGIKICMSMLNGDIDSGNENIKSLNNKIVITKNLDSKKKFIGYIDRKTLTFDGCKIVDLNNKQLFKIDMQDYRSIKLSNNKQRSVSLPATMVFISPEGKFSIDINSIELNVAPSSAFIPPSQAKKLN